VILLLIVSNVIASTSSEKWLSFNATSYIVLLFYRPLIKNKRPSSFNLLPEKSNFFNLLLYVGFERNRPKYAITLSPKKFLFEINV